MRAGTLRPGGGAMLDLRTHPVAERHAAWMTALFVILVLLLTLFSAQPLH